MKTIFDSRKARENYLDKTHVRSSTFEVEEGEVALVELTTHHAYFDKMSFTALRIPKSLSDEDCHDTNGIAKRYHQVSCGTDLGERCTTTNQNVTTQTPYASSVLRWGKDHVNKTVNEYHYITRPGTYYLVADNNEHLMDCDVVTIIEVFKLPTTHNVQVQQVCEGQPNQLVEVLQQQVEALTELVKETKREVNT